MSSETHRLYTTFRSFHSKKLLILGLRARMVVVSSRPVRAFSLDFVASYHFWSRTLPCRLNISMKWIFAGEMGGTGAGGSGSGM